MMEYEAEENDEELKDDAEYAAALEELKHRLEREGDEEEEELEDSDEEFLEDLIAKPEDADEDERNEDRAAMTMKLQRDLGEREEEVYERLIGREDSGSSEEEAGEEEGEQVLRWSTLALEGAPKVPASGVTTAIVTPADLAAKCQANATRRQKIQQLLELRKKGKHRTL
ncbi:hypothetical protein ACSSS7_002164 [Eimeria intestinalis]